MSIESRQKIRAEISKEEQRYFKAKVDADLHFNEVMRLMRLHQADIDNDLKSFTDHRGGQHAH